MCSGLFENTELTTFFCQRKHLQEEMFPDPGGRSSFFSHQELAALTPGLWCVAFFSTAA